MSGCMASKRNLQSTGKFPKDHPVASLLAGCCLENPVFPKEVIGTFQRFCNSVCMELSTMQHLYNNDSSRESFWMTTVLRLSGIQWSNYQKHKEHYQLQLVLIWWINICWTNIDQILYAQHSIRPTMCGIKHDTYFIFHYHMKLGISDKSTYSSNVWHLYQQPATLFDHLQLQF